MQFTSSNKNEVALAILNQIDESIENKPTARWLFYFDPIVL